MRAMLRSLAALAMLATAAAGLLQVPVFEPDDAETREARAIAIFLEAARERIPMGARVLVLTSYLPILDFDFWVGTTRPARVLVQLDEERLARGARGAPIPPIEAMESALRSEGRLCDRESVERALEDADFVLVSDERVTKGLDAPRVRDAVVLQQEGGMRLLRRKPR